MSISAPALDKNMIIAAAIIHKDREQLESASSEDQAYNKRTKQGESHIYGASYQSAT